MGVIEIQNAGKCIKGSWVLKNVNVSFSGGHIYGLMGRNGSGKTMLLKSICGLVRLSEGAVLVDGKKVGVDIDVPVSMGAIIEVPGFLPYLSGFSNLKYLAGLRNRIGNAEIRDAIKLVGLDPDSRKHVGKYSLGMRQRLAIAQAIMEDPDLLLLDEPMNGLDQNGIQLVKEILLKLRDEGKTIVLASHMIEDLNEVCDEIYKMENGILSSSGGAAV